MDTWGTIPKSQVDPETIEEAIARLIQAHDDDENAHIDVGQSLQSHKASEIIDHFAASVVRDKIEFDRYTIDDDFQTIDRWAGTNSPYLENINELQVRALAGVNNTAWAYIVVGDVFTDQTAFSRSPNWQIRAYCEDVSTIWAHWGMFDEDYVSGIGFELDTSKMYAVWFDETSTKQRYEILTMVDFGAYICRFYYDAATDLLTFYVNGAVVHTVTVVPELSTAYYCQLWNKNVVSGGVQMWYSNFHFDADPQY